MQTNLKIKNQNRTSQQKGNSLQVGNRQEFRAQQQHQQHIKRERKKTNETLTHIREKPIQKRNGKKSNQL